MSQKNILLTFKVFCMNFSLELKKIILSHPVTSKQPHKIVQILMRHPVEGFLVRLTTLISLITVEVGINVEGVQKLQNQ
jgi:hypothetical protein